MKTTHQAENLLERLHSCSIQDCRCWVAKTPIVEEFVREIRKGALEEAADIVANEGYASRSVRRMFYDPIQKLIKDTTAQQNVVSKEDK